LRDVLGYAEDKISNLKSEGAFQSQSKGAA
jgi:hypothetical protein